MGLIKAITGAAGGVLADQWKEFIYCDSLDEEVLVTKGQKRISGRSSNTSGEENIISNGSAIAVNEGQCMIIVDNGKVVELCAEPGQFTYDSSTEPSIFSGSLGTSIIESFKNIGARFTFGGSPGKDQRVYFFNTKEIYGNKYGSPSPIGFRILDKNVGLDIEVGVKCHGEYSYKITDPLLFYTNVCGNVTGDFRREEIASQLKMELLTELQPAFAQIADTGIRPYQLMAHTSELTSILNNLLSEKWKKRRGIEIVEMGIVANLNEEDQKMIQELQRNAAFRDPTMAAAHLVGAQAEAMQAAASNEGAGGAMMGFMGMNMAQGAGGMNAQNLFAMGQQQQQQQQQMQMQQQQQAQQQAQQAPVQQAAPAAGSWACPQGHTGNTGKFCNECGSPRPAEDSGWTCECSAVNKGKFCPQCGKPKPAAALLYVCDKCGWEPEDPTKPPKFCPECGDIFDDSDKK